MWIGFQTSFSARGFSLGFRNMWAMWATEEYLTGHGLKLLKLSIRFAGLTFNRKCRFCRKNVGNALSFVIMYSKLLRPGNSHIAYHVAYDMQLRKVFSDI